MHRTAALFVLLAALMSVLPGASFAQSAGDEQYVDPFQNAPEQDDSGTAGGGPGTQPGGDSGSDSAGGTVGGAPEAAPAPAPAPDDPAAVNQSGATGTTAAPAGSAVLPRTGLPLVLVTVLGTALMAGGVALRRGA